MGTGGKVQVLAIGTARRQGIGTEGKVGTGDIGIGDYRAIDTGQSSQVQLAFLHDRAGTFASYKYNPAIKNYCEDIMTTFK